MIYSTSPSSSPRPDKRAAKACSQPGTSSLVNRPLRDCALRLDSRDDLVQLRLNHDPAHDHLAECRVQGLEIEDQVQLANILE